MTRPDIGRGARLVALMCVAEILCMAGFATYPALLPMLRAEWGLSNVAAGFVGGGRYLVSALAVLIALVTLGAGILTFVDEAAYSPLLLDAIVVVWLWQLGYAALALFTSVVTRRAP